MKNSILLDIDTDRERPILFGKSPEIPTPKTRDDARDMILNDIICLTEALKTLIILADQNSYGNNKELTERVVKTLTETSVEKENK